MPNKEMDESAGVRRGSQDLGWWSGGGEARLALWGEFGEAGGQRSGGRHSEVGWEGARGSWEFPAPPQESICGVILGRLSSPPAPCSAPACLPTPTAWNGEKMPMVKNETPGCAPPNPLQCRRGRSLPSSPRLKAQGGGESFPLVLLCLRGQGSQI